MKNNSEQKFIFLAGDRRLRSDAGTSAIRYNLSSLIAFSVVALAIFPHGHFEFRQLYAFSACIRNLQTGYRISSEPAARAFQRLFWTWNINS